MRWHRIATLILMASIALSFACKKKEPEQTYPPAAEQTPAPAAAAEPTPAATPFKVTTISLGKAISSDKTISEPATTFGPNDTIYASVASEGMAPSVTVKARWTYGDAGQLVSESEQTIAPTGPATTEFHVSKASGWPAGKYKVEISVDGSPAGVQEFEVKK
jgi:hypothetical protein